MSYCPRCGLPLAARNRRGQEEQHAPDGVLCRQAQEANARADRDLVRVVQGDAAALSSVVVYQRLAAKDKRWHGEPTTTAAYAPRWAVIVLRVLGTTVDEPNGVFAAAMRRGLRDPDWAAALMTVSDLALGDDPGPRRPDVMRAWVEAVEDFMESSGIIAGPPVAEAPTPAPRDDIVEAFFALVKKGA